MKYMYGVIWYNKLDSKLIPQIKKINPYLQGTRFLILNKQRNQETIHNNNQVT